MLFPVQECAMPEIVSYFNHTIIFTGRHSCNRRADIVFLFDDSESITKNNPDNYEQMKKFMKDVVNSFTSVGSEGRSS